MLVTMEAGRVIRRARWRAGLSQANLASRLGTSQPAVARWEAGKVSPSLATLDRVVAACGLRARLVLVSADGGDEDLIDERLRMTPTERLSALLDGLEFERRARTARPVGKTIDRVGRRG